MSRVHQAKENSDLAAWEKGSTQERGHSPTGYTGKEFNTGTMVTFPSALSLKPHYSVSLCISLASPQMLSFGRSPGKLLRVRESLHGPFKRTPEFPTTFRLTPTDGIPADFHSQMLWGAPLPSTSAPRWGAHSGAVPALLPLQGGTLQQKYPS